MTVAALQLGPAAAAPPSAGDDLGQLAAVLGQSHALRQACRGPDDMYWRERMQRLIEAQDPSDELRQRLTSAFNDGFARARAGKPGCTPAIRQQAARSAERGRQLALSLASP